ncbi:hypothetical protein NLJ89_g8151 [Agrocybe chaxingu]|uniref:Uncharacterized protein n=1 Tax=Agrocybe chaxingu TaxID=84603 RepID=A0A9W8MSF0_9AGAR|nr:hypothetical protein NLJ89_g8151 [Agrocybe chaxingu]
MVQITSAVFFAALVASPSLAAPVFHLGRLFDFPRIGHAGHLNQLHRHLEAAQQAQSANGYVQEYTTPSGVHVMQYFPPTHFEVSVFGTPHDGTVQWDVPQTTTPPIHNPAPVEGTEGGAPVEDGEPVEGDEDSHQPTEGATEGHGDTEASAEGGEEVEEHPENENGEKHEQGERKAKKAKHEHPNPRDLDFFDELW